MTSADIAGERAVRAFVAVELPTAVREHFVRLQGLLSAGVPAAVAWARPEGMHLTLKFLGNVPAAQVGAVADRLARVAGRGRPFQLRTGPLGMFPSARRPRVVWAGIEGAEEADLHALIELRQSVERELATLGFAPEARPFHGHVTLGRVRERAHPADLERLAAAVKEQQVHPLPIPVMVLTLFESQLAKTGARYTPLAVYPLRSPSET